MCIRSNDPYMDPVKERVYTNNCRYCGWKGKYGLHECKVGMSQEEADYWAISDRR